jgi:hypothetical protein
MKPEIVLESACGKIEESCDAVSMETNPYAAIVARAPESTLVPEVYSLARGRNRSPWL